MSENTINDYISSVVFEEIGLFYQGLYEKITRVVSIYNEIYIFHAKIPFVELGEQKKTSNALIKYDEENIDENILNQKIHLKIKGLNGEYLFNDFVNFKKGKYYNDDINGYYIIYSLPKNAFYVVDSYATINDFIYSFRSKSNNKVPTPIIEVISIEELIKRVEDNGK